MENPPHSVLPLNIKHFHQEQKYYAQEYSLESRQQILAINLTYIQ